MIKSRIRSNHKGDHISNKENETVEVTSRKPKRIGSVVIKGKSKIRIIASVGKEVRHTYRKTKYVFKYIGVKINI